MQCERCGRELAADGHCQFCEAEEEARVRVTASSRGGGRTLQRGGFLPGGRNAKIFLKKV